MLRMGHVSYYGDVRPLKYALKYGAAAVCVTSKKSRAGAGELCTDDHCESLGGTWIS